MEHYEFRRVTDACLFGVIGEFPELYVKGRPTKLRRLNFKMVAGFKLECMAGFEPQENDGFLLSQMSAQLSDKLLIFG